LKCVWEDGDRSVEFTWLGSRPELSLTRAYALAFDGAGKLLLVSDDGSRFWLPGGAIEEGETVDRALSRELREEANATVLASEPIGVQSARAEGGPPEYHGFFWARIELSAAFDPKHEITERLLVSPGDFLDTLFWGRRDPKAPVLLARAREIDRAR